MLMEMFMKETGEKIKKRDSDFINMLMVLLMKGTGKMIRNTV